jgi:WD40 repeat protein
MSNYSLLSRFKGGHTATINDVAWAPLAGRSFHMIASCSKDRTIIVWKVLTKNVLSGG